MERFAAEFAGELASETMLVEGVNDESETIDAIARFLARLRPRTAYVAAPTRPPAEACVRPASEAALNHAYQRFAETLPRVELLTGFEGTAFGTTGDLEADLLGIAAVHPLREDALAALLARGGAERSLVDRLIERGDLKEVRYRGRTFYVRPVAQAPSEPPAGEEEP